MFEGSIVAIVTPFKDGSIDEPRFRELIQFHLENGTQGILVSGTTGESATLTVKEKERLFKIAAEEVKGRIPIMAGTGTNDTRISLHVSQMAQDTGVDALLVITPYYNKPTQQGMIEHFSYIAKRVNLPIVMYNVPGRTGINMLPETVVQLSKIKNIIGIKEATGSLKQAGQIARLVSDDFLLISGDDFTFLPLLSIGGKGVISVSANIVPDKMQKIYDLFKSGDMAGARKVHLDLMDLHSAMFFETNPIPAKTSLSLMGKLDLEFRLPLCKMKEDNLNRLKRVLTSYNLI